MLYGPILFPTGYLLGDARGTGAPYTITPLSLSAINPPPALPHMAPTFPISIIITANYCNIPRQLTYRGSQLHSVHKRFDRQSKRRKVADSNQLSHTGHPNLGTLSVNALIAYKLKGAEAKATQGAQREVFGLSCPTGPNSAVLSPIAMTRCSCRWLR